MTLPENFNEEIKKLEQKLTDAQAHELREQKFAVEANQRFSKNLAAFEQYYPDVFKAIQEFQPREDFCLHVTKSGHGNFVPKGKEAPLYSENPVLQAKNQVDDSVNYPSFTQTNYSHYPKDERDKRIHIEYMKKLGKKISSINEDSLYGEVNALPERFPSAIIFGIGLGYHLPILLNKTNFDYVFIIEPDFEQFFASLYCINWFEIIEKIDNKKGCLFLLLGSSPENIIADLAEITEDIGAFSIVRSFCYQHTPMIEINSLIEQFFTHYFQFQSGHGFYNDAVTGLSHSFYNLKNKVPFYDASQSPLIELKNVPVFIIGNGPSLDEAKDFIIENQNKAIIFACGTALTSLYRMGVISDFHILVERPFRNYQAVLDMAPKDVFKNLNLLGVNTVYPDTTKLYGWSGFALKGNEAGTDFINEQLYFSGQKPFICTSFSNPLVANTGLSFALHLGFKNIFLFGVDNGSTRDGKHHSDYSVYSNNKDNKYNYTPQGMDGTFLKGNLGGEVETNNLYRVSLTQLEKLIKRFDVSVYNIGSGAYIQGCIPTKSEDLIKLADLKDKQAIISGIKGQFTELGLDNLTFDSLNLQDINLIFEHIITIASESVKTTFEAADNLKRQQRYLYSFRGTGLSHAFHIIKGSLLYYHCPMITHLFKYSKEVDSLKVYKELNDLWVAFLKDMKSHCERHLFDKCDWELY